MTPLRFTCNEIHEEQKKSGSSRILSHAGAPQTCHFEGAPRSTFRFGDPGARPRNLLSESSWPVASLGPALAAAWPGLEMTPLRFTCNEIHEEPFFPGTNEVPALHAPGPSSAPSYLVPGTPYRHTRSEER